MGPSAAIRGGRMAARGGAGGRHRPGEPQRGARRRPPGDARPGRARRRRRRGRRHGLRCPRNKRPGDPRRHPLGPRGRRGWGGGADRPGQRGARPRDGARRSWACRARPRPCQPWRARRGGRPRSRAGGGRRVARRGPRRLGDAGRPGQAARRLARGRDGPADCPPIARGSARAVSGALVAAWLHLAASRIAAERLRLTDLDAAVGDGDHGINLDRGFAALAARLGAGDVPTELPGPLLVLAGRTITGTVGGASGALYGRALQRAAAAVEVGPDVAGTTVARVAVALGAAVDGIAALGRSHPGEKTMLDALVPAVAALEAAAVAGADLSDALARTADAAEAGARATMPLVATKGRASYLGERSIGHLDPGAVSSALLLRALAD